METKKLEYYVKKHNYLVISFLTLFMTIWLTTFYKSTIATLQIIGILSLVFLGWSLLHHYFDKSLKMEVMIEYLVTVGLVIVILFSFIS